MYDTPRPVEQLLSLLEVAPGRLADLTAGLSAAHLVAPPAPGEWSARDVLAHLRACADMWGQSIVVILNQDRPTIKAINPTTWIKQTDYCEQPFRASLAAFTAQRADLLAVLTPLPPEAWARAATVTGAGKPLERTVYSYAQWLAHHERSHLKQMARLVKALQGEDRARNGAA